MPVGVCGQIIPWNFPLLMLAWKIAPALAPATRWCSSRPSSPRSPRCCSPRSARRPACRRASSTSSPATARPGELIVRPRGRRQDRLHRLDRGRPADPRGDRRLRQGADPRTRRQVAVHRLRRCRPRQRRRGRGRCHLVQPGPGLLRRFAAPRAGVGHDAFIDKLKARHGDAARRRSARQGDRHRRDRRPGAARARRGAGGAGEAEGAHRYEAEMAPCPIRAVFFPPTLITDVSPGHDLRAGRDLRAGAGGDELPHARRGGRSSPTTPNTASPRASGRESSISPSTSRRRIKAGVVWVNCTNQFDASSGFGGYKESAAIRSRTK